MYNHYITLFILWNNGLKVTPPITFHEPSQLYCIPKPGIARIYPIKDVMSNPGNLWICYFAWQRDFAHVIYLSILR